MPPLYYYCAISLNSLKHFLATGFPSFLDHLNFAHSDLPFDMAQGGESLDSARDLEPVEGLVEPFRISSFACLRRSGYAQAGASDLVAAMPRYALRERPQIPC